MENKRIESFEDIIKLSNEEISKYLSSVNKVDIVKSSMGASKEVNQLLKSVFDSIDFDSEKKIIGSVRIREIEDIHEELLEKINGGRAKLSE